MLNAYFDAQAFMSDIDQIRAKRYLTWSQLRQQTSTNQMVLDGARNGTKSLSADTLAALVLWSGLDVRKYMKQYGQEQPA